jgi:riboflavin kinase / FMN adenylyltransferase
MEIVTRLDAVADRPRALAIGTFDGVHAGHRAAIDRTVELARERGLTSAVLTFDRHPLAVVDPRRAPRLLTSLDERIRLIGELDPDELILLPFDGELAAMSAEAFCADLLVRVLRARVVVVGENSNFGAGGSGDAASLRACGYAHGYETVVLSLVTEHGETISSTRARALLGAGQIEEVRRILGWPPTVVGSVAHGEGRGRTLGVPTANLSLSPEIMLPGAGVYVARALVDGTWYRAAVSVGENPTFHAANEPAAPATTEAFLLGFDGDLYGRQMRLDLLRRMRAERRFASVEELVAQMKRDIAAVAALEDDAFTSVGLVAVGVA